MEREEDVDAKMQEDGRKMQSEVERTGRVFFKRDWSSETGLSRPGTSEKDYLCIRIVARRRCSRAAGPSVFPALETFIHAAKLSWIALFSKTSP